MCIRDRIPATYLYNLVSGVIRSMGDSKTPLIFLALAAFVNIGLDLLLIIVFPMGVAGAALATVISQAFSGIACVIYSKRKFEILHTDEEERKVNKGYMKTLCGMGVPMGLQYSITAIGSVIPVSYTHLMKEETENLEQCLSRIAAADAADVAEFDGKFSFTYPYERDLERKNKYSVSELKHRAMREKLLEEETDVDRKSGV